MNHPSGSHHYGAGDQQGAKSRTNANSSSHSEHSLEDVTRTIGRWTPFVSPNFNLVESYHSSVVFSFPLAPRISPLKLVSPSPRVDSVQRRFTSCVQNVASVPVKWTQAVSKRVS